MSDEPSIEAAQTEENSTEESGSLLTDSPDASSEESGDTGSEETTGGEEATGDETGDSEQSDTVTTYADFDLPEGMTVDQVTLDEVTPIFKDLGLTQEQAQKLVSTYASRVQAGEQERVDAFNQLMNDWRDQSLNDKEFGGDNFQENVGIAKQALDKFGTPELSKLLEEHGVGNHPEVIRFMIKVGRLTQEDNPGNGDKSNEKQDRVSILYPKESA